MNRIVILAFMFLAPNTLLAQYSMSVSQSLSSDGTTIWQTVQIDGAANMNFPPGRNPYTVVHTPSVYNVIGYVGGWYGGSGTCYNCYVSWGADTAYKPSSPSDIPTANASAEVDCSIAGVFWEEWSPTIKIKIGYTNYKYDHNDGKNCYYKLDCFTGTPSCYAAPWVIDVNGMFYDCKQVGPYSVTKQLVIIVNGTKQCLGVGLSRYTIVPTPCT